MVFNEEWEHGIQKLDFTKKSNEVQNNEDRWFDIQLVKVKK